MRAGAGGEPHAAVLGLGAAGAQPCMVGRGGHAEEALIILEADKKGWKTSVFSK